MFLSLSFSDSMRRIALSMALPISGVWATLAITLHLAWGGTKKMFLYVYSSRSSSKPSPSSTSYW